MIEILPHEKRWIVEKLESGRLESLEASDDMRNAVENGNVWHDNAEYDEVIERMKKIDSMYKPLVNILNSSEIVNYPDAGSSIISLGSLVRLDYVDVPESADILIVGAPIVGGEEYEGMIRADSRKPDDLMVIGPESPMGGTILGLEVHSVATWSVGSREISANIVDVDNAWLVSSLGDVASPD